MDFMEVIPEELQTTEECDEVLADIMEDISQIEADLRNPPDEYTFGWLRSAKNALSLGEAVRFRVRMRREALNKAEKHNRNCRLEKMFMDLCKHTLTVEQFQELTTEAGRMLEEYSNNTETI